MRTFIFAILAGALLAQTAMSQTSVTNEAARLERKGRFKEAGALLQKAIESGKLSDPEKKSAETQLDILHRIRKDYSTSKEELFAELKRELKDFTGKEFDRWIKDGWFDAREIDGKLWFFDSSPSNLWFRHPELSARRIDPPDKSAHERRQLEMVTSIEKATVAENTPYVLPKTFHVTMHVAAKPDAVPAGDIIHAWV